jgi:Flp pilus assembly pilin Flp
MTQRRSRRASESGGVSIEYALLGAFLGLGIIAALTGTKTNLNGSYSRIVNGVAAASLKVTRCGISGCANMSAPLAFNSSNPGITSVMTSGWSGLESNSTWATGGTSVMTLDLGNLVNAGAQTASLDISANALRANFNCGNPTPCVPVTMAISVNGVNVGSMVYQPNSTNGNLGVPITQSVTLNQAAMSAVAANDGQAVVTLNVDNHARPSDLLPGYGDTRDLSVFVQNVSVH